MDPGSAAHHAAVAARCTASGERMTELAVRLRDEGGFTCQTARRLGFHLAPFWRGGSRHASAFPRRKSARVRLRCWPSKNKEGAGKAGCLLHPQPHARNKKHMSLVTTGTPERSGLPCAMVLTASFVLAPETGLSCLRRPRDA